MATLNTPTGLIALGNKSILTPEQIENPYLILESFPNPNPENNYQVSEFFPEFTSVCPITGQPDFATMTLTYTPNTRCVEMKSLKLYYLAFRNRGAFYEKCANLIFNDLVMLLNPRQLQLTAEFAARGGMGGVINISTDQQTQWVNGIPNWVKLGMGVYDANKFCGGIVKGLNASRGVTLMGLTAAGGRAEQWEAAGDDIRPVFAK